VTCHDVVVTDALVVLDDERHDDRERASRSGWLRRLLVAGDAGRRGSWAFGFAVLGAAAFLASLLLDWQTITVNENGDGSEFNPPTNELTIGFGVGDQAAFGQVYLFGVIGLLAVAGAVLTRPEVAARWRLGVAGAAAGMIAVLIAVGTRLDTTIVGVPMQLQVVFGQMLPGDDRYQIAFAPGLITAYAAVLLPTVAIWLAGRSVSAAPPAVPVTRRREAVVADADEAVPDVVGPAALPEYQRRHNDGPIDLTVTPG
jgi:hypothetical protein